MPYLQEILQGQQSPSSSQTLNHRPHKDSNLFRLLDDAVDHPSYPSQPQCPCSDSLPYRPPFTDSISTLTHVNMVGAGLANLGNTCFVNAILQCFTHTVPLIQGLRNSIYHSSPCHSTAQGQFCILCSLRQHVQRSLANPGHILSPFQLVDNLNHISYDFRRYQEEDAHEFLQCFLDKLERCFLKQNTKDRESSTHQDYNLVDEVFGGILISRLTCCNCGRFSETREPLIDLSLEIEDVDTLHSALESFTKVEKIDVQFRCENCKQLVSMDKQLMLDKAPSIASFHLKRFKTDGIYVEKIDKHVDFPLALDLQPYSHPCDQHNKVVLEYDLYAVVVHDGLSSTSGHYFCFVRSSKDIWYMLDDSEVTKVEEYTVLSQKAYIMFYARQGTPWFSSFMEAEMQFPNSRILITSPTSVLENVDRNPEISHGTASYEGGGNGIDATVGDGFRHSAPDIKSEKSGNRKTSLNKPVVYMRRNAAICYMNRCVFGLRSQKLLEAVNWRNGEFGYLSRKRKRVLSRRYYKGFLSRNRRRQFILSKYIR